MIRLENIGAATPELCSSTPPGARRAANEKLQQTEDKLMKNNSKRLLSTILALVMVIGLIVVMPTTALAKDTLIEIANIDTAAGIQTRFNTALAACSKDDTITVTGYCSGNTATLELDIPQDVTVI